jgi:hypothetical protein
MLPAGAVRVIGAAQVTAAVAGEVDADLPVGEEFGVAAMRFSMAR